MLALMLLSINVYGNTGKVTIESNENLVLMTKVSSDEIHYVASLTWTQNDAELLCRWTEDKPMSSTIVDVLRYHPTRKQIALGECDTSGRTLLQQAVEVDSPTLGVFLVLNTGSELLKQSEIADWANKHIVYATSPTIIALNRKTSKAEIN